MSKVPVGQLKLAIPTRAPGGGEGAESYISRQGQGLGKSPSARSGEHALGGPGRAAPRPVPRPQYVCIYARLLSTAPKVHPLMMNQ